MKAQLFQNKLCIKTSSIQGYGVFADKNIEKGEIIEECYTLLLDEETEELCNYYFMSDDKYAIALGFGSIYNHSENANAVHFFDRQAQLLVITAQRFIPMGEEILIFYGKNWFDGRKILIKEKSVINKLLHQSRSSILMLGKILLVGLGIWLLHELIR